MSDNPLVRLNKLGQSVWYDNIRRSLLESGALERMVRDGEVRGMTSNPTIFEQAIGQTAEYDSALRSLSRSGKDPETAYEELAFKDVAMAADILMPVYEASGKSDGFVSLEVSPALAEDAEDTLLEAKRLWRTVGRPNLMVKIPGTQACLSAVRKAVAEGIHVNVTLLFSVERYHAVIDAYLSGLEDRLVRNLPVDAVSSVASFFVSRVDTKVDRLLEDVAQEDTSREEALRLRGKAAITNTQLAYQEFLASFHSARFNALAAHGAHIQRPLWASTSTKNPDYPDTYYVEALIARDSINTMPPATVEAYREHGNPALRIESNLEQAQSMPFLLASCGIDLNRVTVELEQEGILAFQKSYDAMLGTILRKLASSTGKKSPLANG